MPVQQDGDSRDSVERKDFSSTQRYLVVPDLRSSVGSYVEDRQNKKNKRQIRLTITGRAQDVG